MPKAEAYPLHGGQLKQIAQRFGIAASDLLDFSANINPDGPPPAVQASLRSSVDDLSTLTAYPDLQQADLKAAIAVYAGTEQQNVIVANGFVPLLEATLRTLKLRRCLLPVPCFVEYRKTLERAGVEIVPHPASDFRYDPAALNCGNHDSILLANPQNPSGVCHEAELLEAIVRGAFAAKVFVLLDEAFIDYIPEHSLTRLTGEFTNHVVFRSVTKFHGIPGLRAAYAVANSLLAAAIDANLPPWPITTLASLAVAAALGDKQYATQTRGDNLQRRDELQRDLEAIGLQVYPSAANFVLFRLPLAIDPDTFWRRLIVEHRVVLRSCANYEALSADHFRAAVRTPADNDRLIAAIRQIIGPPAREPG